MRAFVSRKEGIADAGHLSLSEYRARGPSQVEGVYSLGGSHHLHHGADPAVSVVATKNRPESQSLVSAQNDMHALHRNDTTDSDLAA